MLFLNELRTRGNIWQFIMLCVLHDMLRDEQFKCIVGLLLIWDKASVPA